MGAVLVKQEGTQIRSAAQLYNFDRIERFLTRLIDQSPYDVFTCPPQRLMFTMVTPCPPWLASASWNDSTFLSFLR